MKLSQIKEMLSKISKWPWMNRYPYNAITDDKLLFVVGCNSCGTKNKEDLDFIASAPTIIDQLIKQNEVMREALRYYTNDEMRKMLDIWDKNGNLRQQVVFIFDSETAKEALKEVERIEDGS